MKDIGQVLCVGGMDARRRRFDQACREDAPAVMYDEYACCALHSCRVRRSSGGAQGAAVYCL